MARGAFRSFRCVGWVLIKRRALRRVYLLLFGVLFLRVLLQAVSFDTVLRILHGVPNCRQPHSSLPKG